MRPSLEIAQAHTPVPIAELAARIGLLPEEIELYGRGKAKIALSALDRLRVRPDARLVCVTGMTPTRLGEGSTTTLIGITDALAAIGKRPVACLREGSLGPVLGPRGGAAGGGKSQLVPMEDLNLHFTGDTHAVAAANNLLAAMIDASILHGNPLQIDALRVGWRRTLDMYDAALRKIAIGLHGRANGYPRETGFDITAASEVMAILSVARDLNELRRRLGEITVAYSHDRDRSIRAEDLRAAGAMTVLLKDAIKPNLVQTLEGQPALVHGGSFANIDHGNNSLVADLVAMKLGDYLLTESGFGSDMGLEKFFNIVCRFGGLTPSAAVLVTTLRALKHHGGLTVDSNRDARGARRAIEVGMANLRRHLGIIALFGVPAVVAVNRRPGDSDVEIALVKRLSIQAGAFAAEANESFAKGGAGALALARAVVEASEQPSQFAPLYPLDQPIQDKIETIATRVYGARNVFFYAEAEQRITHLTRAGLAELPICIAKTHLSLTSDPSQRNAPEPFTLPVRDIRAYTGAGWLVPLCGEITQMPSLGESPAALNIDIDAEGRTVGLS